MKEYERETGIKEYSVEQKITEVARDILWEGQIKTLVVKEFWDSHGKLVDWHKQNTYKNVSVRLERITRDYVWFGGDPYRFTNDELYINDEKYRALDIDSLNGTTERAIAKAIIGQG